MIVSKNTIEMEIKHRIQFGCNADELAMKVLSLICH